MQQLLECIPNFSEGQADTTLQAIATAIRSVDGVKLLHTDKGESAHRTVMTFAGKPAGVLEAAFQAIQVAAERIDMRRHHGVHPRMGATDVCPLVPIRGITRAEAIQMAHKLAKRVGKELNIPVYLYESAATASHRKNLAAIRKGEYEGFQEKMNLPGWIPDYGPAEFQPKAGQTAIGVRNFLIAYNINLESRNVSVAKAIAAKIRESGRRQWVEGEQVRIPGMCKYVKAIGWEIPEFDRVQVSTNLVNFLETPPHVVFEAVRKLAAEWGVQVDGSELIGLIPLQALLMAGKFYSPAKQLSEKAYVKRAIEELGLDRLGPFDPVERVLEYNLDAG